MQRLAWVNSHFTADGPNQLWGIEMTYGPSWSGFFYLAMAGDFRAVSVA